MTETQTHVDSGVGAMQLLVSAWRQPQRMRGLRETRLREARREMAQ
jgi:hypothetical protein